MGLGGICDEPTVQHEPDFCQDEPLGLIPPHLLRQPTMSPLGVLHRIHPDTLVPCHVLYPLVHVHARI